MGTLGKLFAEKLLKIGATGCSRLILFTSCPVEVAFIVITAKLFRILFVIL